MNQTPASPPPASPALAALSNEITRAFESDAFPDWLIRFGIRMLLRQRLHEEDQGTAAANLERLQSMVEELRQSPIAIQTQAANEQHYEVPTRLYQWCLGPRLKYSSAWFDPGVEDLGIAEERMLEITCQRAGIQDGQDILELGCGWGSLSLWMAQHYPNTRITAVSNSRTQKLFIDAQARDRGLRNLKIITCDMNVFDAPESGFDTVVSVEMFEHMKNYRTLMQRISNWLRPGGSLFVHIFTHRSFAYHFVERDATDWMAKYFFAGGLMPSDDLLLYFQEHLQIERHWRVNGVHYQKTAEAWLSRFDAAEPEILKLLAETYGVADAVKWKVYWRTFFMACAELWGFRDGEEWMVSHYRFRKSAAGETPTMQPRR